MDTLSSDIARKLLTRNFANLAQRVRRGGNLSRSERAMPQGMAVTAGQQEAGHACWVDGDVLEEARRSLAAKSPAGLNWLEDSVPGLQVQPLPLRDKELAANLPVAEKYQPVLAAAILAGRHYWETGDRTLFGALFGRSIQGVKVMSPRLLAEELL